jgi:hypothetical protein
MDHEISNLMTIIYMSIQMVLCGEVDAREQLRQYTLGEDIVRALASR